MLPVVTQDSCQTSYGSRVQSTNVVCQPLSRCTPAQYETDFTGNTKTNECGGSARTYYTRDRTCRCLTQCALPAIEIVPPNVSPVDSVSYIGDRMCQCPDPITQSPIDLSEPLGYQTSLLPNLFYGDYNADLCRYSCSPCQDCNYASQYVGERCGHSYINIDFCSGDHPVPGTNLALMQAALAGAADCDGAATSGACSAAGAFCHFDTDAGTCTNVVLTTCVAPHMNLAEETPRFYTQTVNGASYELVWTSRAYPDFTADVRIPVGETDGHDLLFESYDVDSGAWTPRANVFGFPVDGIPASTAAAGVWGEAGVTVAPRSELQRIVGNYGEGTCVQRTVCSCENYDITVTDVAIYEYTHSDTICVSKTVPDDDVHYVPISAGTFVCSDDGTYVPGLTTEPDCTAAGHATHYRTSLPSAIDNTGCAALDTCEATEFETRAPPTEEVASSWDGSGCGATATINVGDRLCQTMLVCGTNTVAVEPADGSTDRQCSCQEGFWTDYGTAGYAGSLFEHNCVPCKECGAGAELNKYESAACSANEDAVCTPCCRTAATRCCTTSPQPRRRPRTVFAWTRPSATARPSLRRRSATPSRTARAARSR
eukprot:SAG22_NODE_32_length_27675_cov_12.130119_4_plen_599_part_00